MDLMDFRGGHEVGQRMYIQLFSFLACCELLVPRVLQGMVFVLSNQSIRSLTQCTPVKTLEVGQGSSLHP